jgi:hypothetical protein
MRLHVYPLDVPLDDLIRETRQVTQRWDWSRGAFGHALSLPARRDLHPSGRYSYENFPCLGVLDRYPAFRSVFDRFECAKVSFRLLRRAPGTAYAWHTDREKGANVVRFQIPILASSSAFLVATDYDDLLQLKGAGGGCLSEADFEAFAEANMGHVSRYSLRPGVLHYFDTTRVHTLVNGSREERITLVFDLFANDWLRERFPEIQGEISRSAGQSPGAEAWRRAVRFACSGLYPLRNHARAWRTRLSSGPVS